MNETERLLIVDSLSITDKVFLSIDDNKSVSKTIEMICKKYSEEYELYFGNGEIKIMNLFQKGYM